MKVVDEKGKLFGKLNLIDLLVILLILAAAVVVALKFLGGGSGEEQAQARLTYTVRVMAQEEEIAGRLSEYVDNTAGKRDQLMAGGIMVDDAYIVDYWTEPARYNKTLDGFGIEYYTPEQFESMGLVDVCFVVEAVVDDPTTSLVGTQEVRMGKTHIVKTTHFEFSGGLIEKCTWEALA